MTQEYFNEQVQKIAYQCRPSNPQRAYDYWKTDEWQHVLNNSFQKYLLKCPKQKSWETAISEAAYAFYLMS